MKHKTHDVESYKTKKERTLGPMKLKRKTLNPMKLKTNDIESYET